MRVERPTRPRGRAVYAKATGLRQLDCGTISRFQAEIGRCRLESRPPASWNRDARRPANTKECPDASGRTIDIQAIRCEPAPRRLCRRAKRQTLRLRHA